MLLHELQHCRQKDTRIVFLMNLAGILYWFNPFVWYALKWKYEADYRPMETHSILRCLSKSENKTGEKRETNGISHLYPHCISIIELCTCTGCRRFSAK